MLALQRVAAASAAASAGSGSSSSGGALQALLASTWRRARGGASSCSGTQSSSTPGSGCPALCASTGGVAAAHHVHSWCVSPLVEQQQRPWPHCEQPGPHPHVGPGGSGRFGSGADGDSGGGGGIGDAPIVCGHPKDKISRHRAGNRRRIYYKKPQGLLAACRCGAVQAACGARCPGSLPGGTARGGAASQGRLAVCSGQPAPVVGCTRAPGTALCRPLGPIAISSPPPHTHTHPRVRRFCQAVGTPHTQLQGTPRCTGRCLDDAVRGTYPREYEPPC